jgi:hypothetical protein
VAGYVEFWRGESLSLAIAKAMTAAGSTYAGNERTMDAAPTNRIGMLPMTSKVLLFDGVANDQLEKTASHP